MKKQYYEKVNKFWLVSYEIEQAPTYEKSHSVAVFCEGNNTLTTQYNNFWDLKFFGGPHILVAVFCEENNT